MSLVILLSLLHNMTTLDPKFCIFGNKILKNFFLFLAALGLCCCARAFCSCSEWGLLFIAVCRLLIAVASLVAEHGL